VAIYWWCYLRSLILLDVWFGSVFQYWVTYINQAAFYKIESLLSSHRISVSHICFYLQMYSKLVRIQILGILILALENFLNYTIININICLQVQPNRESPEKAIKMLDEFKDEHFEQNFLFYLLLAYRFKT